jgi:hypothetical protein
MPKLPLTVISVVRRKGAIYAVTVAFSDGTTGNYLISETMATLEAVTISALAFGQLMDLNVNQVTWPHGKDRRYAPR